jgi:hypothetical protein
MTSKGQPTSSKVESKAEAQRKHLPRSEEEAKVWALFEEAKRNVRSRVAKELEGELVGEEILNLRLKV